MSLRASIKAGVRRALQALSDDALQYSQDAGATWATFTGYVLLHVQRPEGAIFGAASAGEEDAQRATLTADEDAELLADRDQVRQLDGTQRTVSWEVDGAPTFSLGKRVYRLVRVQATTGEQTGPDRGETR